MNPIYYTRRIVDFNCKIIKNAIKRRYIREENNELIVNIYTNLSKFYLLKIDPTNDLKFDGNCEYGFMEIIYFTSNGLMWNYLKECIGNMNFIKKRFLMGIGSVDTLIYDIIDIINQIKTISNSKYKNILKQIFTTKDLLLKVSFF